MAEPQAALHRADRATRMRGLVADGCHIVLSGVLWLGGTLLAALGILLALAIIAANGEPAIFFAHVDNLASHYLAADVAQRAAFDLQMIGLVGSFLLLMLLARAPAFATRLRRELSERGNR